MSRTKKHFGQHFLRDPRLLARIAEVTGAATGDVVLEIGPGEGTLTAALLDRGATVVAIERDRDLLPRLASRFRGRPFVLVEGDALGLEWAALVGPWRDAGATWRVAGNIPYYITSPLLEKALTSPLPASITFLVQKEVADRLAAPAGTDHYGGLSIGVQAFAEVQRGFTVPAGAFHPPPKVDSTVVHLLPREVPAVAAERTGPFRALVTSLFSYRRKRMARALREATGADAATALAWLERADIDPDARPEVITIAGFARLLDVLDGARHETGPA